MKTIREWFNSMPEPYRTEALVNCSMEDLDKQKPTLKQALSGSFYWAKTPQGADYWLKFYQSIK